MEIRHNKGFNLFELLIVLAIVSILAIVAVPSFLNYLQTNRLIGATQGLYYALQYARGTAMKTDSTIYVSFQTGNNWCYGINSGSACTCSTANSCKLGSTQAPNAGQLTLSATGLTANSLQFEPNHGAADASSTITLTITGQSTAMSIQVGLLGSLFLCSSQLAGYQSCS